MNNTQYLKSAFKKMTAHDKNEASNRLTPMERQALIILFALISVPLMISGIFLFI